MLKRALTVVDEQPSWLIAIELVAFIAVLVLFFTGVLPNPNLIA
jgi:hypothetical protein